MKIEYYWVVLAIVTVVLLLPIVYYNFRKIYAKRKVAKRSTEEKVSKLNADLEPLGFFYDQNQDVISSGMYPWQRELGYCKLYDEAAIALNMAIHCEPIYFRYNNRRWLIEFWKGQYGMTTGGEVGIYVTDKSDISIPGVFAGPFFECVSDEERIQMEYFLYRNDRPIIFRRALHWWLTGFSVGSFSNPNRLSMEIRLTFPNYRMMYAFVKGLEEAGYGKDSYRVIQNTVQVQFEKPKTKQPHERQGVWFHIVQMLNRIYCVFFRRVTRNYIKTLDKVEYLRCLCPCMYRILTRFAKPGKLQTIYSNVVSLKDSAKEIE